MLLTPASGIVRSNPDLPTLPCHECGRALAQVVAWPHPAEWRCVTRGCVQNAVAGEGGRVDVHTKNFWPFEPLNTTQLI